MMLVRYMAAAVFGLALAAPVASAQPPEHKPKSINAREHHQTVRIKDGKEDGELTKAERDRLAADEAAVRAEERVYRKSGDGLTKRERRDLEKDLNKTSHEIYRAKHNPRKPK